MIKYLIMDLTHCVSWDNKGNCTFQRQFLKMPSLIFNSVAPTEPTFSSFGKSNTLKVCIEGILYI